MAGGDWTPEELSSQTVGWYKADIITGKSDGDEVDSWTDSSGESNTLTQTQSGADPIYKTNIINSLPVLRFDKDVSPGDNLLSADLGGDFEPGTGDFYIAMVMKLPSATSTQFVMSKADSGVQGLNVFVTTNGTLTFRPGTTGGTAQTITQTGTIDDQFHIYVCRRVSSIITGHFDGATFSTDTGSKVNDSDMNNDANFRLGSSSTGGLDADMDLSEAMIATGTLSDDNRDRLTGYLAWKYGLQANLPDDHPYRFSKPKIDPKVWQGGVNNDLGNGLNWSGSTVPTAKDKVLFNSGNVDATTGSLTAGSVFITDGYTGSIGTSSSPRTFTADEVVIGSSRSNVNIQLASNTKAFVTESANGVKLTGSSSNIFVRSKDPTTLALSTANTQIDVRHPSGNGGLCSHTSGVPFKTTVGFGGAVERSVAANGDTLEVTGNGSFRHITGAMPEFIQRGGNIVFNGTSIDGGICDLIGGVFNINRTTQPVIEMSTIDVYPGGLMDLTGPASGQVDFGVSKVLRSVGGSRLKLGSGRSAAMS